jgi:hypothetical protein
MGGPGLASASGDTLDKDSNAARNSSYGISHKPADPGKKDTQTKDNNSVQVRTAPVYAPPPVSHPGQMSPGISLFVPLDVRSGSH